MTNTNAPTVTKVNNEFGGIDHILGGARQGRETVMIRTTDAGDDGREIFVFHGWVNQYGYRMPVSVPTAVYDAALAQVMAIETAAFAAKGK